MANWKKLASGAAGAAGAGEALNVEDVFSTYLFNFASAPYTVTNGIDLSGEGGLVWIKGRNSNNHWLHDSERTLSNALFSNLTDAEYSTSNSVTSLNSNGFTVGGIHSGSVDHASWTFRKAPKFFDVVTYTGDGTAGRQIAHNLGTTVGTIIVKRLNAGTNWGIYHRSNTSSPEGQILEFDTGATGSNTTIWNNTAPTSTVFTVGNSPYSNFNGSTYVAYIFAHNDGDGEFGPTGDQDIIKCGSFTTDSSGHFEVDLGFEAQWVLAKRADSTGSWTLWDNMRGFAQTSSNPLLANSSGQELNYSSGYGFATSTGFKGDANWFGTNASNIIYIAIRNGPMAVPESADEVFKAAYGNASGEPAFTSGFPADFGIWHGTISSSNENRTSTRLTQGKTLDTDSTDGEQTSTAWAFDYQDGFMSGGGGSSNFATMWRRAPNFFDVVAYTGNASTNTLDHNLGVAPEMIWYKARNLGVDWRVHANITSSGYDRLVLNSSGAKIDTEAYGTTKELASQPTATQLVLGGGSGTNNGSSYNYIAYLFASLDGVSKVGSYTGTSASQTIDCGFSSGARFVLIKETSGAGNWYLFDTERGITSTSNDGVLQLNTTSAQLAESAYGYDMLQPHNSGFTLTAAGNAVNFNNAEFIFYAIA